MSLKVTKLQDQASGQFNGGTILENKPIGFPQDGGKLKPYSNLFYWAHAWTPGEKSLIGEHPHQGFEIMSFVLKGSIEHYDNKNKEWRKLNKGDAQIIRSGNGITHAEMVNEESEFFQIWLDPNLRETLSMEPTYNDYVSDSFPVIKGHGRRTKIYKGEGSPMDMHTRGVEIHDITFNAGEHEYVLNPENVHSMYLMDGEIKLGDQLMNTKDYAIVEDQETIHIESDNGFRLFVISGPKSLEYRTYAQQMLHPQEA